MLKWPSEQERQLLQLFPKTRAPLPPEYAAFHEQFYSAAREGKHAGASIALRLEQWMHKQAVKAPADFPLLELGAGTLNHVRHESTKGCYDIVEPMRILYAGRPELQRINNVFSDINEIPEHKRYARIISIATFEHILNAPEVLARTALSLAAGGALRTGIPSEGGLIWYLAYMFGTGTTFRLKYGLSYSRFQRYEHVNKACEIEGLCRIFFESVRVQRWPISFLHGSFYTHIEASSPKRDVASRYLEACRLAQ